MAVVDLEAEEMKEFEYYRLSGGFPSDDREALNMFKRIKALAESCGNTDE